MENIITQLHEDHGHWTSILAVIDAELAKLMADESIRQLRQLID